MDMKRAVRGLSRDFAALAVGRFLGRLRDHVLRWPGAYVVPALLAVGLLEGGQVSRLGSIQAQAELAALEVVTRPDTDGIVAQFNRTLNHAEWSRAAALLANVGPSLFLDLSGIQIADLGPLEALKNLQRLDLRGATVTSLEPVKALTSLKRSPARPVSSARRS
jgi:hypothetical protein